MGVIGRYIDAISDEQRDRIIEAKAWCDDFTDDDDPYCHCLVGHAEAYDGLCVSADPARDPTGGYLRHRQSPKGQVVFVRFMSLGWRFGMDRIVRLCKARAAKGNAPTEQEATEDEVAEFKMRGCLHDLSHREERTQTGTQGQGSAVSIQRNGDRRFIFCAL